MGSGANGEERQPAQEPRATDAAHGDSDDFASKMAKLRARIQALGPDAIAEIARRAEVRPEQVIAFCNGANPLRIPRTAHIGLAVLAIETARAAKTEDRNDQETASRRYNAKRRTRWVPRDMGANGAQRANWQDPDAVGQVGDDAGREVEELRLRGAGIRQPLGILHRLRSAAEERVLRAGRGRTAPGARPEQAASARRSETQELLALLAQEFGGGYGGECASVCSSVPKKNTLPDTLHPLPPG
jgi:hypothetical protein